MLQDLSQQLGSIYVYWNGGNPVLVLSKPKVIEDTIVNGMKDGSLVRSEQSSKAWNDISGPILLGQNGAEWQWRRKAWNPEFSFKTMRVISCLVLGIPVDKKNTSHEGLPLEVLKIHEAMSIVGYRFLRVAVGEKRWMKYLCLVLDEIQKSILRARNFCQSVG